jgi:GT2 family glycosyltransferase
MDGPLVSIIVINYKGRKYLQQCLDSLLAGNYRNIEIILVDNGSQDGSADFIRENYPQVTLLAQSENLGLAKASNLGAASATGEYLFFYNNDTIADKFLIERLAAKMQSDSSIGICGCRTYTYDGKYIINEGVACDIFGYPYAKGEPFYVDAAIFVREGLFRRLGGFDEEMFLYGEDRDLCWRCWLYGYRVAVEPQAFFFHDSACISEDVSQYRTNIGKRFWGEFNALRSILKNYSLSFLLIILPFYILINFAEVCVLLLRGDIALVKGAYLRSYAENLRLFADTIRKRALVQIQRRINDFALTSHMSKVSGKLRFLINAGIPRLAGNPKYAA